MTTTIDHHGGRLHSVSVGLTAVAVAVVAITFAEPSGRFLAGGAYASLVALVVATANWRTGDRTRAARVALVVAGLAFLVGIVGLAIAIGLMGWASLWFMGSP